MSPKKIPKEQDHKRRKITAEIKCKIIKMRERGVSVADLTYTCNRSTSTICRFFKRGDKNTTKRLRILDDVERLLRTLLNEKQLKGDSVNDNIICEKAKVIFTYLAKKTPGSSMAEEVFKGIRAGLRNVREELASTAFAIECDIEESEIVHEETVVKEIVSLAKVMELEVDKNDINELVEEYNQQLTT
ncbi:hypothetical protein AVEN_73353-1 [Araneus ventricosus]|uniref:HTH psq-type domain-containing protein n=1 Tax=Araneus ventricosus TaxID=182803 RepID=A0A4Y2J1N5_ARAVE|nr:hypothetical protein AVEN_73353-1 [Araneus ventricosus]